MNRIDALRYLIEVAKCNSINLTAEKMFVSKSTVSISLKNLEEDLNLHLLDRTYRGVTLTSSGQKVVVIAKKILDLLDSLDQLSLDINPKAPQQVLNIYILPSLGNIYMPNFLKSLYTLSEHSKINVHECTALEQIKAISASKDNIAFAINDDLYSPLADLPDNIAVSLLFTSNLYVISAPESRWIPENKKTISLKEMVHIPLVIFSEKPHDLHHHPLLTPLEAFGEPQIAMNTTNSAIYFQAIANDVGIGVLMKTVKPFGLTSRDQLRFTTLRDKIPMHLSFLYNKDFPPEKAAQIIALLQE